MFETALMKTHKDELREQPLIMTDLHLIWEIIVSQRLFTAWREEDLHIVCASVSVCVSCLTCHTARDVSS